MPSFHLLEEFLLWCHDKALSLLKLGTLLRNERSALLSALT